MVKQLRTPFVLLAIAGLLGAGVYWFESRKSLPRPEAQGDMSQPIVVAPERDIEALTIIAFMPCLMQVVRDDSLTRTSSTV